MHPRSTTTGADIRRLSIERSASRYRTLSAVAANVATTAALAAQHLHDDIDQRRGRRNHRTSRLRGSLGRSVLDGRGLDEDTNEGALAALADSFHSERGPEPRGNRVSWINGRDGKRSGSTGLIPGASRHPIPPPLHLTSEGPFDPTGRGRSLQRGVDLETEPEPEPQINNPNRHSSRASRRGATVVFLGVWVLIGIGTFTGNKGDISFNTSSRVGIVLAMQSNIPRAALIANPMRDKPMARHDLLKEPYGELIMGRIFAWICAILYVTSRLPQIWENFVRKSVEGLSIFLFIFAFLGNTFYVASILSSPKMQLPPPLSSEFIRESIPYLLGSGGTLMFDIVIVFQSFTYRPRPRHHSLAQNRIVEEETSLLTGEP